MQIFVNEMHKKMTAALCNWYVFFFWNKHIVCNFWA